MASSSLSGRPAEEGIRKRIYHPEVIYADLDHAPARRESRQVFMARRRLTFQRKAAAAATDNLYRLDLVFQALSDRHRRFMLTVLSRGPRPVSDLAGLAVASWSAGLKHLRLLEASGLIHTEKIGRVRTCYLNADTLKMAEAWLGKRRTTADRSNRPLL